MYEDDVIAEVRKAKERIAKQFGYDVRALARALREEQGKDGRRVVNLSPKRPIAAYSHRVQEE
jgi:hypothetical protein